VSPPLTPATARAAVAGDTLRDREVQGLQLRCTRTRKAWYLYYRSKAGEERRPKLGDFPAMSLSAARESAKALLQEVAQGRDPSGGWRAQRTAPTMAELHEWFMCNHSRPNKAPRSAHNDQYYWDRYAAKRLGRHRVAEVTAGEINRALGQIAAEAGAVTANRIRALLSTMLAFAETTALQWRPLRSNPVTGRDVPRRPEFPRRRYITPEEFGRLGPAMAEVARDYPRHVACLACILYSGSRVTEMATARWDFVRGDAIVLRQHKAAATGRERVIRLPASAWALIRNLPQQDDGSIFGPDMTLLSVHRAWSRIRQLAGIPDVQPRDLRRSFASLMRSSGAEMADVGHLLGHSTPSVTAKHYAFLWDDAASRKVEAAGALADKLLLGLTPPEAPPAPPRPLPRPKT
jgi:integrase